MEQLRPPSAAEQAQQLVRDYPLPSDLATDYRVISELAIQAGYALTTAGSDTLLPEESEREAMFHALAAIEHKGYTIALMQAMSANPGIRNDGLFILAEYLEDSRWTIAEAAPFLRPWLEEVGDFHTMSTRIAAVRAIYRFGQALESRHSNRAQGREHARRAVARAELPVWYLDDPKLRPLD